MTNPPPPPASAMGLVEKWQTSAAVFAATGFTFDSGTAIAFKQCADELAAALSLSEDEREAVARCDFFKKNEMSMRVKDYDILRAIIARAYVITGELP